ncbi:MAG: hypothetical protein ACLRZ6_13190 [Lachnospiraceae bacterium]
MERIKITKINDHIWLLNDNNEAKSLNINLSNRKENCALLMATPSKLPATMM